jgi:hypothetical protein
MVFMDPPYNLFLQNWNLEIPCMTIFVRKTILALPKVLNRMLFANLIGTQGCALYVSPFSNPQIVLNTISVI